MTNKRANEQSKSNTQPSLSICVCTYNRADLLHDMLAGLLEQTLLADDEILVVNNNCSDHTSQVVAQYAQNLPIREVFEPQQGLSHARNRALAESRGDVVVFLDDDVLPSVQVAAAYRAALVANPDSDFFGGKITVAWAQGSAPIWWSDQGYALLDGLFGNYNLGEEPLEYRLDSRLPYGANFAITRRAVERVGKFDTRLGMIGPVIGRGEESDFFVRALHGELKGTYVPNAVVAHRLEPHRLRLLALLRYGIAKGKSGSQLNVIHALWLASVQALLGTGQWLRGRRGNALQCLIMVGIHLGQIRLHSPERDKQP